MSKILLFDIKHYALHDGSGIRSTFFFKGCTLRCPWCHNPESGNAQIHTYEKTELFKGKKIRMQKNVGQHYGMEELLAIVDKNQLLYEESGGGITLSGGEPLMQAKNAALFLKDCKSRGIHTCVDTSGCVPQKELLRAAPHTDEFLYDIKLTNDKKHHSLTGVSNHQIISNLKRLDSMNANLRIRFPLIPDVNDDHEALNDLENLLCGLKHRYPLDILPYHKLGSHKKKQLRLNEKIRIYKEPSEKQINTLKKHFEALGFDVKTGG